MKAERRLEGLGISPGIAIGPVFVTDDNIAVPEYRLDKDQVEAEVERFSAAVGMTYKLNRSVQLKGEFQQYWLRSNVTSADYNASVFLLGP